MDYKIKLLNKKYGNNRKTDGQIKCLGMWTLDRIVVSQRDVFLVIFAGSCVIVTIDTCAGAILQPNLMYSWAHSDPVVTQSDVIPGKLPSLDWLLKPDSGSVDEKSENVHQKRTCNISIIMTLLR